MSSVTDSQISSIAHPVQCNFDVQCLLSSGCSEKLIHELIQYNKSTYQAYVSVVHAVTNPGGSSRSGSGKFSSRSSLLSSPTGSYRAPSPVSRASNLPSRKFSGTRGFGSASLVRPSNYFSDRIQCASVSAKEGFCYTKLFRSSRVDDVASVLGPWPALESILAHPVRDFRALSSMGALSLYDSDSGYHLDVSGLGLGGLPVVDVMKTLSEGVMFPAGSMGKEMSRSSGSLLDGCGVMLSSRIGGSSSRLLLLEVKSDKINAVLDVFREYDPVSFGNTVFITRVCPTHAVDVVLDSWFLRGFKKSVLIPIKSGSVRFGSKATYTGDVYGFLRQLASGYGVDVICTDFGAVGMDVYAIEGPDFDSVREFQGLLRWPELQRTERTALVVRE
nr:P7 protein [Grapevine associated jivivirus 1]